MYYQVPEGFEFDPKTGQYRSEVKALDETGKPCRVVTWFDAELGSYAQEIVPLSQAQGASRTGAAPKSPARKTAPVRQAGSTGVAKSPQSARRPVSAGQYKPAGDGPNVKVIVIAAAAGAVILIALAIFLFLKFGRDDKDKDLRADDAKTEQEQDGDDDAPGQIVEDYVDAAPVNDTVPEVVDETTSAEASADSPYGEEESREMASFLLSAQENTWMDIGAPIDYQGIELYDYSLHIDFTQDGDVEELSMNYLPALTPDGEMNFDADSSVWQNYTDVTTLDKWMEGEKTACVRCQTEGFTVVLKLNYDTKRINAFIEERDGSADPDSYLSLIDGAEDDFATPEDVEKGRQVLIDSGWNL